MLNRRFGAQLLCGPPASTPELVVERLLAVQGQDQRGARLAIRARSSGLRASDVDRGLTENRTLVITWLNRGTLHLVRSEDYPWLHALTAPRMFATNARRLAEEGLSENDAKRGVEAIKRSVADEGPRTRAQLAERVSAIGVRTKGQALIHILMRAALLGVVVRGPMVGRHHAYVLVRDWLGEQPYVDRDRALAELARRYLAGHGPATEWDLAKWVGLPVRDARAGLRLIGHNLNERSDGLVELVGRVIPKEFPPPRLLGPFDPVLLGWTSREPIVGPHEGHIVSGGMFKAFALVRGRAAGTWRIRGGRVELEPFEQTEDLDTNALAAEAAFVEQFLAE